MPPILANWALGYDREMKREPAKTEAPSDSGKLLLEIWEHRPDGGQPLPSLEIAGPRGEASRALLPSDARLLTTLRASSHYEAMTLYYRMMGWGSYTADQSSDHVPYPDEWLSEQKSAGLEPD
jgi:hypothetical protein